MRIRPIPLILLSLVLVAAAGDRDEAKYSDAAEKTAAALRVKIQQELKSLQEHPWAGEYYEGDGLGVNVSLAIAPESGYVFEWHGCMGVYDRNYGAVAWTNGNVLLSFTFDNNRKGFQGIAKEFTPVPWGARVYLIPSDEIIGFCNEVNDGREPRAYMHGSSLLRTGDEKKDVSGFPGVPAEYQAYLLKEPIEAEIVTIGSCTTRPSVCEWKFRDTTVMVNVGKDKGVRTGMKFRVVEPANVHESVCITKVEDARSEGVVTQAGEDKPGPQLGWKLSTQARWNKK